MSVRWRVYPELKRNAARRCIWPVVVMVALLAGSSGACAAERYVADYLRIGVGARPLALGSASVALLREACAFYWNPAGVSLLSGKRVHLEYTSAFGGFGAGMGELHVVAVTLSLESRAGLGLAYIRYGVDDIPRYPELQGTSFADRLLDPSLRASGKPLGFFEDREQALYVSFARAFGFRYRVSWLAEELTFQIPLGVSFKYLQQRLDVHEASGIGLDVGGAFLLDLRQFGTTSALGELCLAWQTRDITNTTLTWENRKGQHLQTETVWGLSYRLFPVARVQALLLWQSSSPDQQGSRFGVEVATGPLALRAGKKGSWPAFGIGLELSRLHIDYAANMAELGNIHRISLELRL